MSDDEDWIPIEAIFDEGGFGPNMELDPRASLELADVIFGRDVMTQHQFLLYGREALERIVESGDTEPLAALHIELDQDSEELEKIIALIEVMKGRHDYAGPPEE